MADRKIKVSGDVGELRKEITKLTRDINREFSKTKKLSVVDKETRDFLNEGAKKAISDIKREISDLNKSTEKANQTLRKQEASYAEIKNAQRTIVQNTEERVKKEKELNSLQKERHRLDRNASKRGQFVQGLRQAGGAQRGGGGGFTYMSGRGRMLPGSGTFSGLSAMGKLGAGVGAAGLLAGGFAASRGIAGVQEFQQGTGERLTLQGRGLSAREAGGMSDRAQQAGFTAPQVRGAQVQAMDIFGREGATPSAVAGRMETARATGVGISQLQQAGAGLRQGLGTEGARKAFAKLQANLISTEMEGAIGPYLQTAAQMLTQMNEDGVGLDRATLAGLSELSQREGVSPERAGRVMAGLDQSMKQASGERAAFFMSALASQGIGGGTVGGAQVGMQQGIMPANAAKLSGRGFVGEEQLQRMQQLGLAVNPEEGAGVESFQKRMRGISGQFEKAAGGQGVVGRMLMAQKITGMQSPTGALEAMGMIKELGRADIGQERREKLTEKLQEKMQSPQEKMLTKLDNIMKSTAGITEVSQAIKQANLEVLGSQLAPAAAKLNTTLANLDKTLVSIMKFFGIETVQQQQAEKAKKGELGMEEFARAPKKRQKKLIETVSEEMKRLEKEKEGVVPKGDNRFIPGGVESATRPKSEIEGERQELSGLLSEMLEVMKQQIRETKKTQNTGMRGRGRTTQ